VGAADAEFLENEFTPEFTIQDMVNLPNWHIYLKIMTDGISSRPFSAATLPPFKSHAAAAAKEQIIQNARKRYARPRYIVEEEIRRWSGMLSGEPIPTSPEIRKSAPPLSGTLRPPAGPRPKPHVSREPSQSLKHIQSLSELGIEFAPTRPASLSQPPAEAVRNAAAVQPPAHRKEAAPAAPPEQAPSSETPPPPAAPKTLSLKDLKSKEKAPKHKHGEENVDIAGMRHAIKETFRSYIEDAAKDSEGK
jgi:hypothetical protein